VHDHETAHGLQPLPFRMRGRTAAASRQAGPAARAWRHRTWVAPDCGGKLRPLQHHNGRNGVAWWMREVSPPAGGGKAPG